MSDQPATHALLDTENLFRGFREKRGPNDRERGRLIRHFPRVTPEVSAAFGYLAADDLVDWLEARWQLQIRRSFGKRYDPGVEATREALKARGFALQDVPVGKNQADIAVVETVVGLAGVDDGGHIALGGEDNLVLDAAADLCKRTMMAWTFTVVMPDSKTEQWRKFDSGAKYETMDATALDLILAERRQLRRASGSMRAQRRRLVLGLRRYSRRESAGQSPSRSNFVQALEVICRLGQMSAPGSPPSQHWMNASATKLADAGLEVRIAHALVSWIGEFHDGAANETLSSARELLLSAAIDVFCGDEFDPSTASATRTYVARSHPEILTPLERAIARFQSNDPRATRTG
jgi:hypothetical protein